jgi:hypothetical protein
MFCFSAGSGKKLGLSGGNHHFCEENGANADNGAKAEGNRLAGIGGAYRKYVQK